MPSAEELAAMSDQELIDGIGRQRPPQYEIIYINWLAHNGRLDVPPGWEVLQILERYPETVLALLREER